MESAKKILVIENDQVVLILISHILTRQSFIVQTATDVDEAEKLLESEPWDAILLDLKMPTGDGVEILQRLQTSNPDLLKRIIVVTGAIHELPRIHGVPIWGVVKKPFEVAALLETVRGCIDGKDRT